MTFDTTTVLVNLKGKPYKDGDAKDAPDLTVGIAIANILAVQSGSEPRRQYELSLALASGTPEIEITVEDAAFMKRIIDANAVNEREKAYFPYILGQCQNLIESSGKSKVESKEAKK